MDVVDIVKIEPLTDCFAATASTVTTSDHQQRDVCDTPATKKQRKSAVWKYFTACDDDVTKVVCNICKRVVSRGKDFGHLNTSAMYNHMHYKHRSVEGIYSTQSSKQSYTTAAPVFSPLLPLAPLVFHPEALDQPNQPMAQTITETVGEMVCVDLLPYSFVDNKGFRKLMRVVAPHYTLPTGSQFSCKVVPKLHQRVTAKVQEKLQNVEGNVVHCTADIWTERFSTSSYLSLTGHWFVQDVSGNGAVTHRRVNALLSMKVMHTEHTPGEILRHVQDIVEEWQAMVSRRFTVRFVVTDDTCNVVKAMSDGGFERVRCLAHSLHLIVTGAIEECHGVVCAIDAARQLTNAVHMSDKAVAKLHKLQKQLGLTVASLIHDVPSRWNTVLFMLQRLLGQKKALIAVSQEVDLGGSGSVSEGQWTLMEAMVKVLEPFEEATRTMCRDDASISSVIPCIQALRSALNELKADKDVSDLVETCALVGSLQSHLEEHFKRIFETPTSTYFKATLLDPRFKIMPMVLLGKADFERLKAAVAVEVEELLEQESTPSAGGAGSSSADVPESKGAGGKSTSLFWGAMQSLTASLSKTVTSSGLVETYLAESSAQSLTSDPVISYWSTKMKKYSALARVAIKYLACPPTTVSSERLLSTGDDDDAPPLDRHLPAHVPQLVFTKYNLMKCQ